MPEVVDTYTAVVVAGLLVFAMVLTFGIARAVGSNERGNDDHELTDPPDNDQR